MSPRRRLNPIRLLLVLVSALLVLCALAAGGPEEVLGVMPAILLALALCFDRYPGEVLIERLRRRGSASPAPEPGVRRRQPVAAARRRLLALAAARSLRGPPVASLPAQ